MFSFLLASSGAVALLVYLVIAVSQLKLRKKLNESGQHIAFKMWFYPWLSYLVIFCILSILTVMLMLPEHRMEVIATGALTLCIVCMGSIFNARKATAVQTIKVASTESV